MILRLAFIIGLSLLFSFDNVAALQNSDKNDASLRLEKAMSSYAACLLTSKRRETAVNAFLLIPEGHNDQNNLDEKLIVPDCAKSGEKLSFNGTLFRRSLYTALYNKHYRKTVPDAFPNAILDYNQEVSPNYGQIEGNQLALRLFSDCTIKSNAASAHAFVVAQPYSDEETGYMKTLAATLNDCIAEGAQLSINRSNLKSIMAEALYKMRMVSDKNLENV